MNEPRRSEPWIWILGSAVFCLLVSPEPLLLDEETHRYIAKHTSFQRPYDWAMPFPPFQETGFIFAHPPLFHWWLKLVGDSMFALRCRGWYCGGQAYGNSPNIVRCLLNGRLDCSSAVRVS